MHLSRNFTLAELTKSQTAIRAGIKNDPGEREIANLKAVCEGILEPVRQQFGPFSPSSGFRCLKLNRALLSKDTSQHIQGEAADFEIPGVSNRALYEWIKDNLEFDQLILEFFNPSDPMSGWVHCSFLRKNRNEAFEI